MTDRPPPIDRLEVHNTSVDEDFAQVGACAQIHLPTGQICTLPHHHSGSCSFAKPGPPPATEETPDRSES